VVIDERTLRVIATVPGGNYPDGMAYDQADGKLFISDEAGQTETVIDTKTNQVVATIALGGEAGNTQYDPMSGQIFVDVQTLNLLVAIDPTTDRIIGRTALPGCEHDHSLLLDTPHRLAFVTCDGNAMLLVVDLRSLQALSTQSVGADPDVLAFDHVWQRLYVAAESGILSVFEEQGRTVHKVAEGFVANEAHSVAVDEQTHRLYLPLEDLAGKPVLRIAFLPQPSPTARAKAAVSSACHEVACWQAGLGPRTRW
jgi:YVTN family beta-propeller protein